MECNKDEAIRAKEIAEKKFASKDAMGALKFALKAQNLYPELDGVQQMIATFDIHVSAQKKVNGEYDWYRILSVDPRAGDDLVRKQYRRLALFMHPDKNKCVGADEAFKLVSQAWSSLSDKAKRTAYDQARIKKTSGKVPTTGKGVSSAPPRANGFHNSNKSASSSGKTHNSNGRPGQVPHKQKSDTFWTVCQRCKTQYEYLRIYLNHNLLCPNCHSPFFAIEIPPPPSNLHKSAKHRNISQHKDNQAAHWGTSSGVGSSSAASAYHQANRNSKREREEGPSTMKREEALRKKTAYASTSKRKGNVHGASIGSQKKVSSSVEAGTANATGLGSSEISGTESDRRKIIMQKAKTEIRKKLDMWKLSAVEEAATKDQNGDGVANGSNFIEPIDKDNSRLCTMTKSFLDVSIDVPDPDFHDFGKDRVEKSFAKNQVWATYDIADGMPRRYALIHDVVSSVPFKLQISWLIPSPSNQYGLLNWIASGFQVACGDFAVGRCEISESLNSFSHKVWSSKGSSSAICILPRKGDVWALYRNWSPHWNELTASEKIHKYDLVEVLEDYDEELGVTVIPLVKVAGFRAMFHHHWDFRKVRRIPKEEISRFSHYVPSFLHRGQEAPSAPRGCKELDPAATPDDLVHVVASATEGILENEEDV